MKVLSNNHQQLLFGTLVALAMITLTVVVFALFAHEGPWRVAAYIKHEIETLKTPRMSPQTSSPSATASSSGASGGGSGAGGGTNGGGSGGGSALMSGPAPNNAADALRQLLGTYHDNPNATMTVSLSTSGKISTQHQGSLTVNDGLNVKAMKGATLMTGNGPGVAGAQ